jgi:hypothetical protein
MRPVLVADIRHFFQLSGPSRTKPHRPFPSEVGSQRGGAAMLDATYLSAPIGGA